MKRICSACLTQTIHFQLKEDLPHDAACQAVREEYALYKSRMEQNRTRYKIIREQQEPDGSLLIEVKKQYNSSPCGTYLD